MKFSTSTLTIAVSALLASCGTQQVTSIPGASNNSLTTVTVPSAIADAESIPIGYAQAVGLRTSMARGLDAQSLKNPQMTSVLLTDFAGAPFSYLNITADGVVDPLTYGLKLSDEQARQTGKVFISLTGASDVREFTAASSTDQVLLQQLATTVQAIGGKSQVKRLLSLDGSTIYVEGIDGRVWPVGQRKALSNDNLKLLTDQYLTVVQDVMKHPAGLKEIKSAWKAQLTGSNQVGQQSIGELLNLSTVSAYLHADGTLDVARMLKANANLGIQSLEASGLKGQGITPQRAAPHGNIGGGYAQSSAFWEEYDYAGGWLQMDTAWNWPKGIPQTLSGWLNGSNGTTQQDAIGCAPSAAQALMYYYWAKGNRMFGLNFNGELPRYSMDSSSNFIRQSAELASNTSGGRGIYSVGWNPIKPGSIYPRMNQFMSDGRRYTTSKMNGSWFVNGTLTEPGDFVNGFNQMLRDANQAQAYVQGVWQVYGRQDADGMESLISSAWNGGHPVVAQYSVNETTAGFAQHYAPIAFMRVESSFFYKGVLIRSSDQVNWETNVSNRWSPHKGVYTVKGLSN